jgi:Yip1 domain
MSLMDPAAQRKLVDRARAILLHPKEEWLVIDKEPTDVATLFRGYVAPLAAIPPIATFIGSALFGSTSVITGVTRVPIGTALVTAILSYVLSLASTYVLALVIDNLAPRYGGTSNRVQAFKVAAYSGTPQWLAGIFGLIPALNPLSILGIYGLYLLYLGLPPLMRVAPDKATTYTITVVVVVIVVSIVIAIFTGIIAGLFVVSTL